MKKITASFLDFDSKTAIEEIAVLLDEFPKNKIDNSPWAANDYKPKVDFAIAYNNDDLFIKYFVQEKFIQVKYSADNEPVYEDSCVEIFVSFNDEDEYYNFEFNCIGACLAGFGKKKIDRTLLSAQLIRTIKHQSVFRHSNDLNNGEVKWELVIMIPYKVFGFHNISSFKNKIVKANFYKCGDQLPKPHFLTWNNIIAPAPEFHLPQFFGTVEFV